jgi:hypothetical protein
LWSGCQYELSDGGRYTRPFGCIDMLKTSLILILVIANKPLVYAKTDFVHCIVIYMDVLSIR